MLLLTVHPAAGWRSAAAARAALVTCPAALWAVAHVAAWWQMRALMAAFRCAAASAQHWTSLPTWQHLAVLLHMQLAHPRGFHATKVLTQPRVAFHTHNHPTGSSLEAVEMAYDKQCSRSFSGSGSECTDVPLQLQPLLAGAWLVRQGTCSAAPEKRTPAAAYSAQPGSRRRSWCAPKHQAT